VECVCVHAQRACPVSYEVCVWVPVFVRLCACAFSACVCICARMCMSEDGGCHTVTITLSLL